MKQLNTYSSLDANGIISSTGHPDPRPLTSSGKVITGIADQDLLEYGWAREWRDDIVDPDRFKGWGAFRIEGYMSVQDALYRDDVEQAEYLRNKLANDIDAQVVQVSAQQAVVDPGVMEDVRRSAAAATERHIALDETADADLPAFDSTIDEKPPQDPDTGYAYLEMTIAELPEWAGQPGVPYGFLARLTVPLEWQDEANQARVLVVSAPTDTGAVLPFLQDADDPAIWTCTTRDGFHWSDPEESATLQLMWGGGSIPTSPKITCERLHDRTGMQVRYGL